MNRQLKKIILFGLAVMILLLDWAALDDITTGHEPSLTEEYLIVLISIPILLATGYFILHTDKPVNS